MKILLISHFFPPTHNAGAEKQSLAYALGLKQLGHDVQVVCAGSWNKGPKYWNGYTDDIHLGIPVRRVHLNWTAAPDINRNLYDSAEVEEHLDAWLQVWQPEIVQILSMVTLSTSVVRSVKKRGLPVFLHLTDFWLLCPRITLVHADGSLCEGKTSSWDCLRCMLWNAKAYRGLSKVLPEDKTADALKWVSKHPKISRVPGLRGMAMDMDDRKRRMRETFNDIDRVSTSSHILKQMFEESGVVSKPVRVIHTGHDLSWVQNMPPTEPSESLRFGFIGQIVPHKGIHLLIQAFQSATDYARTLDRKIELQIYGDTNHDPSYSETLRQLVRPGDNIKFMGGFGHDQLGSVLSQFDTLVVPSQWLENNPRVVQEAFASKTPVIASDVGGISEFIQHGVDGLLFAHDSVDSLTEQLCAIIKDENLLGHLQNGIPAVKTIEDEIEEVVQMYYEVLKLQKESKYTA